MKPEWLAFRPAQACLNQTMRTFKSKIFLLMEFLDLLGHFCTHSGLPLRQIPDWMPEQLAILLPFIRFQRERTKQAISLLNGQWTLSWMGIWTVFKGLIVLISSIKKLAQTSDVRETFRHQLLYFDILMQVYKKKMFYVISNLTFRDFLLWNTGIILNKVLIASFG